MNGIAALCTFIASFSPPLGDSLMTLPTEIRQPEPQQPGIDGFAFAVLVNKTPDDTPHEL